MNVDEVASHIQQGKLVVFPTDTVWGIGCDPFNEAAIDALYTAKKRPPEKSIPVLVSSFEKAHELAHITPQCESLLRTHWPGALTVVLTKKIPFPKNISQDDTIALRMPNHPEARALIEACGGALATTSANISGTTPITNADEARTLFRTAHVLDGIAYGGMPSTIIDCTKEPHRVLRQGPIAI